MEKIIKVEGMSCDHCVMRITNVINEIRGAKCLKVSLEDKTVTVTILDDAILKQVFDAIEDVGYEVIR
jgi:copper chaperone